MFLNTSTKAEEWEYPNVRECEREKCEISQKSLFQGDLMGCFVFLTFCFFVNISSKSMQIGQYGHTKSRMIRSDWDDSRLRYRKMDCMLFHWNSYDQPHRTSYRFCPACSASLEWRSSKKMEEIRFAGAVPSAPSRVEQSTPVLAAIVEQDGHVLLAEMRHGKVARSRVLWRPKITEGVAREVLEETSLEVQSCELVAVHSFERMNQVIITYHVRTTGEVSLSPELAEYKWMKPEQIKCWPQGTGLALAQWLRSRGIEPQWMGVR